MNRWSARTLNAEAGERAAPTRAPSRKKNKNQFSLFVLALSGSYLSVTARPHALK